MYGSNVMGDMNPSRQFSRFDSQAVRRLLLSAFAGAVAVSAVQAQGYDPIGQALRAQSTDWSDGFDTSVAGVGKVRTAAPILSPETVAAMRIAIERYSQIAAMGGWPVVPGDNVLRLGMRDPNVRTLRERLMISGDLPQSAGMSDAFNSYVDAAVRRFQARHGVPSDGVVGPSTYAALNIPAGVRLAQLSKNLQRLTELAANPGDRYVLVNIPAAEIEAVDFGRVTSRHTAVVGKIDRQTPILNSRIYEVNFNPFWTVPASIIKKDLIPLMQKQPSYLAEQRIRIYDQRGNELQPEQIDWYTDEAVNYMFRQDPGDFNSLGSVRINFYNKHSVYMHDTPSKTLFGNEYRFDSSGCVRVQNVRELITWLLRDTDGWSRENVDEMFRNNQRLDVKLAKPVSVFFAYLTAWSMEDGVVHFRNDIYDQDNLAELALR